MPQNADFTRFVTLIDLDEPDVQNVQEMATLWGQLRQELEEIDVHVEDAYAVLGEIDFLVIFRAPTVDTAFKADVIMERYGLGTQTMEITPTEHFADLVEDV